MDDLEWLADVISRKNGLGTEIASIRGRPALIGHVGERIASEVFGIVLGESASWKGIDGGFRAGPLAGRTVDIKWTLPREEPLDINPEAVPDVYLVFTGPARPPASSRGTVRPWVIEAVYLFDGPNVVGVLRSRGVKLGVATSVAPELWEAAEVYPVQRNPMLELSDWQRRMLSRFGSAAVC